MYTASCTVLVLFARLLFTTVEAIWIWSYVYGVIAASRKRQSQPQGACQRATVMLSLKFRDRT